ncbi:MAG: hypothetical protein F6K14_06875 [Symploca sp. SIO2C1]|nr:hypothetical protein [Symploca sp. SIO2C1]
MNTKKIEAIYPLSPSQQGILIETLASPGSGIHIERIVLNLQGNLDQLAWERAWQFVIERHSILRTGFVWKNQDQPAQFVLQTVQIPLEKQDWRELSPLNQQEKLADYIETKGQGGFNLTQVPIIDLALFQVGEDSYQFVWMFHHILLDGWSLGIILPEVLNCYQQLSRGQDCSLKPTHPYRNYIAWLQQQDLAEAQTFWQTRLEGFTQPTSLGKSVSADNCSAPEHPYGQETACLSASATAKLQSLVKQNRLTFNILLQGVWALLLSRYSDQLDVVFGTSVSGRPSEISGIESMAGMFINTVPIRCQIVPDASIWYWLQEIQQQQLQQKSYEYCSQGQIHDWSELSTSLPMYESILVVENYPVKGLVEQSNYLNINVNRSFAVGAKTNYPLTILALPGSQLELVVVYHQHRFEHSSIVQILKHFLNLLARIAEQPEQDLVWLKNIIPEAQIPEVKSEPKLEQRQSTTSLVIPRDPVETKLAKIWSSIFDLKLVGIKDNFFELGGHSLLALRLMAEIEQVFGKTFPLGILFQGQTIEKLAAIIREETDSVSWSSLVPIQTGDKKLPFFCVPGAGGNVIYFSHLARYLDRDQPFYGLQAVGLDGVSEPYKRIEDMAAHYIQEIQSIQPQGPYLLGGHSFGSQVAFEMAQQLQKKGQKVALLAILDTNAPFPEKVHENPYESLNDAALSTIMLSNIGTIFGRDLMFGKDLETYYEELEKLTPNEQFNYLYEQYKEVDIFPSGLGGEQLRASLEVMKVSQQTSYFPQEIYPTKITLFRSEIQNKNMSLKMQRFISKFTTDTDYFESLPENTNAPDFGWGRFSAGPVEIYQVPGNHLSMVAEPHVQILAQKLMTCIKQAQAKNV